MKLGTANAPKAVIATMTTSIGLTIDAATAACPRISAPTIPRVGPITPGILTPASRISSIAISIISTSTTVGKGTFSRLAAMAKRRSVGIISGWKLVSARYMAGRNIANMSANVLTTRRNAPKGHLRK